MHFESQQQVEVAGQFHFGSQFTLETRQPATYWRAGTQTDPNVVEGKQ